MHDDAGTVAKERVEAREKVIKERIGENSGDNSGGISWNSELYLGRRINDLMKAHGGDRAKNTSSSLPLNSNLLLANFQHPHMLQCWFNPGMHLGTLEESSKARIYQPEEFPILRLNNDTVASPRPLFSRLLMGAYGGKQSPVETWKAKLLLLDCYVANRNENETSDATANSSGYDYYVFDNIPPEYTNLWVYACTDNGAIAEPSGEAGANGSASDDSEIVGVCVVEAANTDVNFPDLEFQSLNRHEIAVCQNDGGSSGPTRLAIRVKSPDNSGGAVSNSPNRFPTTHFLIGAGAPFNEKWVKLLGNDGALLGPDEEYVRGKMAEFEANPEGFGK